jgi:hypothetical protein
MKSSWRAWLKYAALITAAGAMANACSAAGQGSEFSSGGDGGSKNTGGAGSTQSGGLGGGDIGFDGGSPTGAGGLDKDAACGAVSSEAQAQLQPADIIIAVDTSGSMDEEIAQVQANLNNFATLITSSGIDVHVIMIADSTMCIPEPLGNGLPNNCNGAADEKLPNYRHVQQTVASTDALQLMISTYPQWKDSLRPGATKTLAVVSDDESDMSAADFTSQLLALDPPTFQGFKFDAIVVLNDPGPLACFGFGSCPNIVCCAMDGPACMSLAAAQGDVYKALVAQTGGVQGDLCVQDFNPVFQDMAQSVIQDAKLACDYTIPPPPNGQSFDSNKVNVAYTPGGQGMPQQILNVPGGVNDCGPNGGWYYDDPAAPKKVIMCPSTCSVLQERQGRAPLRLRYGDRSAGIVLTDRSRS